MFRPAITYQVIGLTGYPLFIFRHRFIMPFCIVIFNPVRKVNSEIVFANTSFCYIVYGIKKQFIGKFRKSVILRGYYAILPKKPIICGLNKEITQFIIISSKGVSLNLSPYITEDKLNIYVICLIAQLKGLRVLEICQQQ
ncbi:hypothetical protein ASN18_1265 [Candidatus Magnetominusculus xianensis]|uniref:Uncharacterized protein n=1 Tax=Candidatus Magnetominusculus xianensis TaxID=1748249 RepID=A0ABR5SGA9_9BACT|nr:hypothetical protein ASN18_1265 [Candidatus Magnetominusculus xianensis]